MKKIISTIVAVAFVSGLLVNSAYAGNGRNDGLNPLWVPVAILSVVAAAVATAAQVPVVYGRPVYPEPRRTVVYEEPRHYGHERYYERYDRPSYRYYNDRGRSYDAPRYREYR